MKPILNRIKQNALASIAVLFGISKKIDYKTLNRYIVEVNQVKNIDSIMVQASKCLKEILGYRLFAFVMRDGVNLDAWIDPNIFSRSFEDVIRNDFNLSGEFEINQINMISGTREEHNEFRPDDLVSFELNNAGFSARLYLIPERKMFHYHHDIMNMILKTIGIAVSNFLNIKKLKTAAAIDPLTGCLNRREFNRLLNGHFANARRYEKHLSILMFDIDFFKKINDSFGHQTGDKVLKEVASSIQKKIRKGDILARYGGEEFIVLLPETKKPKAIELAERLRKTIENKEIIANDQSINVTASFGVSTLNGNVDTKSIVYEADAMLYKAKANGRNVVMPGFMRLYTLNKNKNSLNELLL